MSVSIVALALTGVVSIWGAAFLVSAQIVKICTELVRLRAMLNYHYQDWQYEEEWEDSEW